MQSINEIPKLVRIGASVVTGDGDPSISTFPSWDAFVASRCEPLAFFIEASQPGGSVDAVAVALRQSRWAECYAFVSRREWAHPLLDGLATPQQAGDAGAKALARINQLGLDRTALDRDERLLLFLYLRDQAVLTPELDRTHPSLYRYPLAEAIGGGDQVGSWLAGLVRRGLLEAETLVDRTRHCPSCNSAHLQFVDVCPQCSSIQINKQRSLHCFGCGHVATESDFEDDGGLLCPKCHARLRHIGVDYDRPLAQHACASCHHVFIEPKIVARCIDCRTQHEPDRLDVHSVATLRLSSRGRAALRAGQIHEGFAALDIANFVVPAYFRHMLDWMLVTARRHKEFHAGVVLLELENAGELIERLGAQKTFRLLDEFASRLRQLVRTSDVTTRTSEERLWLLLPFSSPDPVVAKLNALLEQTQTAEGERLKARVTARHLPSAIPADVSAGELMDRMQREYPTP